MSPKTTGFSDSKQQYKVIMKGIPQQQLAGLAFARILNKFDTTRPFLPSKEGKYSR